MLAGRYDITIEAGATFTLSLTYVDDTGAPVDLTGYTARMQLRAAIGDTTPVIELSTSNGRISIDTASGQITLNISATDTGSLTGSGVYDPELVNGVTVERLIEGLYTVNAEVTR